MRWRQGCFEGKFARISIAEGRGTLPPRALIVDNRLSFESLENSPRYFQGKTFFFGGQSAQVAGPRYPGALNRGRSWEL